tara:strand:+ start:129 stop:782 length:654 start_codon:yes stop_codon:yes gene_type:complete
METYLYFRKFRPATFLSTQGSATQVLNTITGLGGDDIDDDSEIASLVVTAGGGSNTAIGSAYSAVSTNGDQTTLSIANGAIKTTNNSVITLNTNSEDGDSGYTLESGDTILVTLQQGLETSFMYPASSLIGIEATATGQTTLRFKSLKGDATDDVVAINHDNAQYQGIVDGINTIVNGSEYSGIVTVIDGHGGQTRLVKELDGFGIDGLIYTPESGY